MTQTRNPLKAALLFWLVAASGHAQAITLDLPLSAVTSAGKTEGLSSYAVPVGPYANGMVPTRRIEGALTQTAWRIDDAGSTTLELLAPLRAQLAASGFQPIFECDSANCGGFDFRFGTSVLPEPEMHVDLGDFRFFAAERGPDVVSLIVSRTKAAGFVQMIHVGEPGQQPVLTASTKAQTTALVSPAAEGAGTNPDLVTRLMTNGSAVLDDLVFASGTSDLASGDYASLRDLAVFLRENPDLTIALVGHTDASGGLESNIALSRKRADAVRAALVNTHKIPAARVESRGVGYLSPRATNLTDAGREKNRRVEVMVTSTRREP